MNKIIVQTGSDIDKVSKGIELELVEKEFYTYCIRTKFSPCDADKLSLSLKKLVPDFLRGHGFKPNFDSLFMICDKTYINTLIYIIKQNAFFSYIDKQANYILSYSLKHYIKFLSSKFDPRTPEYKRENAEDSEFTEGKIRESHSNVYERKRSNRQLCLAVHGYKCAVCEFDFEKTYGEIGKEFIEVHHIIPLSQIRKEYIINPENDLIPLCSNCHSMIHRKRDEAMPIEEFKKIYDEIHKK